MKRIIKNSVNRRIFNAESISSIDIDNKYIDKLMKNISEEVKHEPYNATCIWDIYSEYFIFILTNMIDHTVNEYTCPIEDLTGNTKEDKKYILETIENFI